MVKLRCIGSNSLGVVMAALVAGTAALAQAEPSDEAMISSTAPHALDPPTAWQCDRIAPEYRGYLRRGGREEDWRFTGKTYRDEDTDTIYRWSDWREWYDANCAPSLAIGPDAGGGAAEGGVDLGLVGGVFGVAAAILLTGSGDDEPGGPVNDSPG